MDLSQFKEALGEKFGDLEAYVQGLERRDSEGKAKFKKVADDRDNLRRKFEKLAEHYGIDTDSDLTELPPAKQDVEAQRQYEARLKRLERERDEAIAGQNEVTNKFRESLLKAELSEALSKHEFVATDIVSHYIGKQTVWDEDGWRFKTDDGKMLSVKDGVATIAKTRPELLKPTGTGGAGVRQANAGSGAAGMKTRTRAEWDSMSHADRAAFAKEGGKVVDA